MRRLMFLLSFCFFAPFAHAQTDDTLLQSVLTALGQHAAVRADFVQTRSNPALEKPQVSRGQLLFVLGHGMLWQTQAPFAETLAFTGRQAARIDPQGLPHPMRDARGAGQISQMLQAMLAGHADEVRRQFDIAASGSTAHWTLRLVPKQARVARVLGSIELSGDAFLESIRIAMRDGGATDIRFSQTRDAGVLSRLEKRALGLP
ncbi:MAG: outer membrane lipoprotein carrier protein LolA [Rhodanobacter sp.]